jgi:hypothetical protein
MDEHQYIGGNLSAKPAGIFMSCELVTFRIDLLPASDLPGRRITEHH